MSLTTSKNLHLVVAYWLMYVFYSKSNTQRTLTEEQGTWINNFLQKEKVGFNQNFYATDFEYKLIDWLKGHLTNVS